jgi:hypothetical protein
MRYRSCMLRVLLRRTYGRLPTTGRSSRILEISDDTFVDTARSEKYYGPCVSVARLILLAKQRVGMVLYIMTLAAKLGCSICTTYSDQLGCKCARQSCKPHMTWESACIKPIVVRSLEFMEVGVSSFSATWHTSHHRSSTTPCIVASHCVAAWLRMRFSVYRNINVFIDDL